jgi:flavin reductase (DIM6/NTAB) family NADH-FMN oxidoreductase RutF
MSEIEPQILRAALGSFVTGITIVTARAPDGTPVGLTVNSFNSVSLDPPLVLWSLALKSQSLPSFREAKGWAVHVLAAGQEEMSARFATPGADKFADLDLSDGPEGAPALPDYAARFGCEATFEYEGGDHAIFVGHVIDLQKRDAEPLIYHGGRYSRVAAELLESGRDELALNDLGRSLVNDLVIQLESGASLCGDDRRLLARLAEAITA